MTSPLEGDTPPTSGSKLDLILYRLQQIEAQTKDLVTRERYDLEHAAKYDRLDKIERRLDKQQTNSRTLWVAIGIALIGPILTNLGDLINVFGK